MYIRNPESNDIYIDNQREYNSVHKDGTPSAVVEIGTRAAIECASMIYGLYKRADLSILDVGCRLGYCIPIFEDRLPACSVVGIDIVPEFVEVAKDHGEAQVVDTHNLPYTDRSFDCIFSVQTLEHCYNPSKVISEWCRVARLCIFASIPLETPTSDTFINNPSHYVASNNPVTWLNMFNEQFPTWRLYQAWYPKYEPRYFNMMFGRYVE